MRIAFPALLISGACCAMPAAATPTLSGTYVVTQTIFCQIQAKLNTTTGQLALYRDKYSPDVEYLLSGTITFAPSNPPTQGNYTFNTLILRQSAIFETLSSGGHRGLRATNGSFQDSNQYANDDTTLSLGGYNGGVYNVVYGAVDQNGVPDAFSGVQQAAANQKCVTNLVGHR